jgi:hypothetical protein
MSDKEYARTSAKKRADTAKGKQYSKQPDWPVENFGSNW